MSVGDTYEECVLDSSITSQFKRDDVGNSERFLNMFGKILYYNVTRNRWHIWTGQYWKPMFPADVESMGVSVTKFIYEETSMFFGNKDEMSRHFRFAQSSNCASRVVAMIRLSQGARRIEDHQFDTHTHKINMRNGVYDLSCNTFTHGGVKEELHSKITRVAYDPGAKCEDWLEHLDMVFGGNKELIETFQIASGYSLLGNNSEYMFICHGCGKNGKSVTIQTLTRILGDYGCNIDPETILELRKKGGDAPKEDLIRLAGIRFVFASEPSRSLSLNVEFIKRVTGGDPITARPLYGSPIEFEPAMTMWLNCNHSPRINETTEAIKSRLVMIPFDVTIQPEKRKNQKDVIDSFVTKEGSGIFNWMLEGLMKYRTNGNRIKMCREVECATNTFFDSNDKLERFIRETCMREQSASISKAEFRERFNTWCNENDEESITPKELSMRMLEKGYSDRRTKSERYWLGIRAKKEEEYGIAQL